MTEKIAMHRQGDLLFVTARLPRERTQVDHLVLAEGEATGHAHRVTEGEARQYVANRLQYLTVRSRTAIVTHEEHGPIVLRRGTWRVVRQREYAPEEVRYVAD